MKRSALICGVSGQDGSYLAAFLLSRGYTVWGTSRDAQASPFANHRRLGIAGEVHYITMAPEDFRSVLIALNRSQPDEIYFLAGQTSVGLSFEQPAETIQSISQGTLNLLEAVKMVGGGIRTYFAGSGEVFGETIGYRATEISLLKPRSPYAVAKAASQFLVSNYREAYDLFACTGILFNHESPLRPARFVTQKIVSFVAGFRESRGAKLSLGSLDIARDWGWAEEYVQAMWLILQQDTADDFVIATGQTNSLEDFVATAFGHRGLDWRDHVVQDPSLMRPTDIKSNSADGAYARSKLGWEAQSKMSDVIALMLADHEKGQP